MAISSRITPRSMSTSSDDSAELVTMSQSTLIANDRSESITRAWKQVSSREVNAFISPPTDSSAAEISTAERFAVPLNNRCSRKCDAPASSGGSSRDPTPTQMPIVAERTPGIASVTTRKPPGRTVRRTRPPSSADSSVRVVPCAWSGASGTVVTGSVARGRAFLLVVVIGHRNERQLAAVVDLADLDLNLLTDRNDVLDGFDALVVVERAQLADVQ